MVKARPPGKDGQSMACRKALGIYAVVTVSSPSMMVYHHLVFAARIGDRRKDLVELRREIQRADGFVYAFLQAID